MIACLAWTDLQIINMVQVKETHFPDEEADLFVDMIDRVSENLVKSVRESRVFRRVCEIMPKEYIKDRPIYKIPFLAGIVFTLRKKRYYAEYFPVITEECSYRKLLLAGFWGDSLFFLRHLWKQNKSIRVGLVEEGALSYCASKHRLCQAKLISGGKLDWAVSAVLKILITDKLFFQVNRMVDSFYLYEPSAARFRSKEIKKRIPRINRRESLNAFRILRGQAERLDMGRTLEANVFFFPCSEPDTVEADVERQIFEKIIRYFPPRNVTVKLHPNMDSEEAAEDITWNIDRQKYMFETAVSLADISKKILIAKNSSCLLTAKYMFGYEPVVIYLNKLYLDNKRIDEVDVGWYVEKLRFNYRDEKKIWLPENVIEFESILKMIRDNN